MPKTPGKMHMYDMVKIDTIVFEIIGGWGAFNVVAYLYMYGCWSCVRTCHKP